MSELDKLVPALLKAQSEFPVIGFDATNPHFRNRYATLSHLIAETRPVLGRNGLAISQLVDGDAIVTLLLHVSGQQLQSRTPVLTDKPGPQAMGSGITYARRYGLCAILGIAAEDDDDGEGAQQRRNGARVRDQREAHEAGVPQKPPAPKPAERDVSASVAKATKEAGAISVPQSRLFWIRCAERAVKFEDGGVTREEIARDVLRVLGVEHTKELPARSFDRALELIGGYEPGKYAADAAANEAF